MNPAEKPTENPLESLDSNTDSLDMPSTSVSGDLSSGLSSDLTGSNNNSTFQPTGKNIFSNISPRTVMIVSTVITLIVLLITSFTALLLTRNQQDPASSTIPTQDVDLGVSANDLDSEIFSGKENALFVNGDVIADQSLIVNNSGYAVIIKPADLSAERTITLPNASGTVCLSSNNCDFATDDQLQALTSQLGQIIVPNTTNIPDSSLVNGQIGAVSIQGTSNRISVSTSNGVIRLSTPQDIAKVSSPTFSNLILAGNLSLDGTLTLPLDCTAFLNGGSLTTNGSGRVICADDETSGGGTSVTTPGGSAGVIPVFTAADIIEDSIVSQALGTISIGGNLNVANSITFSNLANGFLRVNGSGVVSVDTIDLGTDTNGNYVANLTAGNGVNIGGVAGEGWSPTVSVAVQANKGLEVDGSGLSLVDCSNGQILKYNGSNQWACASDNDTTGTFSIDADTGTPETVNNGDTVNFSGGNNISTSVDPTDTITIDTVNNPNFTVSVTTPLLQSSGALSITPGGALSVGATGQTALLQGSTTTITSNGAGNDIVLTTADQIRLTGFNCTTFDNGGALTTDASGNISCQNDDGDPPNGVIGAGSTNRVAIFTGPQSIGDSWILQNGSTLELDATRDLSLLGGNFSVVGTGLFSGLVTANGGLTVQAGDTFTFNSDAFTDLTGTGLTISTGSLQTTLGTSVDLGAEVSGTLPVGSGGTGLGSTPSNGQLLIGNGAGYTLATLTQGAGITITNGVGSITVASTFGSSVDLGVDTAGDYVEDITAGNGLTGSASGVGSNPILALGPLTGNWNQTGAFDLVLNNASSELSILESIGGIFFGTLDVGDLTDDRIYTLPDSDGEVCLVEAGNCAGSGTGVTTSGGTTNRLTKFTSGQNIEDSAVSEDGTNVTVLGSVDLIVQGGDATLGTAVQDGSLTIYNNGFAALVQAGLTGPQTYTLPDGSGEICIKEFGNCSGGSGGNAPVTAQYLTLALDGTLSAERVLAFNGTNFSVADGGANGNYSVNTAQNINTAATPTFAGLTLNGNLNVAANTISGTTAVIDFTNFDVASNGNTIVGGTLDVSGLTTLTGGLTVQAGDTFTFNSDAFTDLTGTGLTISTGSLQTTLGTSVDLASEVNGVLPILNGGTGANSQQSAINNLSGLTTEGDLLFFDGADTTRLARGSNGQCLTSTATSLLWSSCTAGAITGLTLAGTSGTPQAISNGDTITIAAGSNITTTAIATDTVTVDVVSSPTFSGTVTANAFVGDGSALTDLDADELTSGTVDPARITGDYTGITGVGTLNAGNIGPSFGSIDTGSDDITTTGTVTAGTLSIDLEDFTDLTGNGLQNTANVLTLSLQSDKGLEVDSNGLSLIDCSNGEILKYNGSNQWACAADGAGTGVTAVGAIDSQSKSANGAVISSNTIYLQTADGSFPGLVSTSSQTFAGDKTFSGLITANGNFVLQNGDTFTINSDAFTDLTGTGLINSGGVLTVDNSALDDNFFINDGNSFGGAATLGTNDSFGLNLEVDNTTVASFTNIGEALFKNASDSSNAFQIQNSNSDELFRIDSLNNNIYIGGNNSGELQTWQTSSETLPAGGRTSAASVTYNGYIYFIGGSNSGSQDSVYYAKLNNDGSTGAWQTNSNVLPEGRSAMASTAANGYVYVLGGILSGNRKDTVYYAKLNADGSTGAWQTNANALPAVRQSATSIVSNGYIYVIGGTTNGNIGETTVYYAKLNADGSTGAWQTNVNALPEGKWAHTSVVANGYVYAIGGTGDPFCCTGFTPVVYAKLNADGSTGAWQTNANALPSGRVNHTSVVANGYVYVLGGSGSASVVIYAKLNADGSTGAWQTNTTTLPADRLSHASVIANGYVYVLSGRLSSPATPVDTVFYASTQRIQFGGSLDLVGLAGGSFGDSSSDFSLGSVGGSLTAGNTNIIGTLQVQGGVNFTQGLTVNKNLNVGGYALFQNATDSTTAFEIQNAAGTSNLLVADTTNTRIGVGTAAPNTTFTVYNGNESLTQTDFTQALNKGGINIVTDFTDQAYTPGIFWSTQDNNSTKPKAGIYMFEDGTFGTSLLFGTSNAYATGITNTALTLGPSGSAIFKNGSDSSAGFQVRNSFNAGLLTVNTSTNSVITSSLFIDTLGSADTDTVLCHNSSDQVAACSSTFVTAADLTLQSAYDGGNTITTANNKDLAVTLANSLTTDSNFRINIATGSTSEFQVEANGTDILQIGSAGQLQLDVQGNTGGIVLGTDANLYRDAAGVLKTDGALWVRGEDGLTVGGSGSDEGIIRLDRGDGNASFWITNINDEIRSHANGGNSLFTWYTNNTVDTAERMRLDSNGQLQLHTQDDTGGILIGGDAQIYRSGANELSLAQEGDLITFNGDGDYISFGADSDSAYIYGSNDAAGDWLLAGKVSGDANERLVVRSDGEINWGDGTASSDTSLYRSSASTLATNGGLVVNTADDAGLVALRVLGTDPTIEIGSGTDLSYIDTAGLWSDESNIGDSVLRAADGNLILSARNASGNILFTTGAADTTKWLINTSGHLLPNADDSYDIGSDSNRVRDLYVGGETIHIGDSTTDESTISYNNTSDSLIFRNATNSTTAFQLQDKDGNSLLTADSSNKRINVIGDVNVGTRFGNRLFSDNFESGSLSLWDQGSNGASISTSIVHGGKYSTLINPSATDSSAATAITPSSTVYMRSWVYIDSQTSGNADLLQLGSEDWDNGWVVYRFGGNIRLYNGTSTVESDVGSGGSLSLDAWHLIELRITVGAGTGTSQVWLDGTQVINATSQNNGTPLIAKAAIGDVDGRTFTAYFDDVAIDTAATGTPSSLHVDDSFHVGGNSTFGNSLMVQNSSGEALFTINANSYDNYAGGNGSVNLQSGTDFNIGDNSIITENFFTGDLQIDTYNGATTSFYTERLSVRSSNNSDSAFQVQNADGDAIFSVNTAESFIEIQREDYTTDDVGIVLTSANSVDWVLVSPEDTTDFRIWNEAANDDVLIIDQDGETRINAQSNDVLILNNTDGDTGVADGEVAYLQYEIGGAELWESGVEDNNTYFLYNDVDGELGFTLNSNEAILQVGDSATEGLTVQRYDGTEFFDAQAYDPGVGQMLASFAIGEGFPASEVLFTNGGNDAWSIGSSDFNSGGADGFYLWNDVADEETLTIDSTSNIWVENGSFNVNVTNNNAFVVEDNSDVDVFAVDTNGAGATGVTIGNAGTQIEKVLHFAVTINPGATSGTNAATCQTATVTGAATTDRIIANPDPNTVTDNFGWHGARVSATNTVQSCFTAAVSGSDPGANVVVYGIIITP